MREAGESLMHLVNTVEEEDYMTGPIITWVSGKLCYLVPLLCIQRFATDFLQRYLSTIKSSVDTTLDSPPPTPLLRQWAKSKLTGGSWRDALLSALNVSIPFCSSALRLFDLPLFWSLKPRDPRFTGLSATALR